MKLNINKILKIGTVLFVFPVLVFAEETGFLGILNTLDNIFKKVIPLLLILATLLFIWGLISYITGAGDEKKRAEAKHVIFWSIVVLFAMVAVWGLVSIIGDTFNIETEQGTIPGGPI